ncbi:MAG TPA: VOC family protein [Acidimicrobiales bacterium]|nr:VOC family protein [Acidimicrobiales bacterium]
MTEVLAYHHLSLSVTDLGKSTEWYQQVLGLDVAAEIEGDGFRRTRLRAAGSGVTLTLTSHEEQSGEPFSERRAGMDHVAFQVGGVQAVEELKRHFEELGVTHSQVKSTTTGTALITLRDPDNIQIEVFGGPVDPSIAAGR